MTDKPFEDPTTIALDRNEVSVLMAAEGLSHPCFIVYGGAEPGRRIDLPDGDLVIGRGEDATLRVEARGISRRHATLRVDDHGTELSDLGSANGTYVNDRRVEAPLRLKEGDLVRMATLVLRFHDRRSLDVMLHDRLYRMATIDAGTGIFNRRYTQEVLRIEVARARRAGTALAVLCADLDHFKSVNDRYGHAAGDQVLRHCAERLRAQLRSGDVIGRWGGEEFVVIAPGAAAADAAALAERLRTAVCAQPFELFNGLVEGAPAVRHEQTLSLGVAVLEADQADEKALFERADLRLYAAKHAGRNRVVAQG